MRKLESAFELIRALSNELLDDVVRSAYLYAVRLAATSTIVADDGSIIDVSACLEPFRRWLVSCMVELSDEGWEFTESIAQASTGTRYYSGNWHRASLCASAREVANHLSGAVSTVCATFPALSPLTIQNALQTKQIALALGGGGGTGFVHQSLFQSLENIGVIPAAITGTSIGSLMGFLRALQYHYDAAASILMMPGWFKLIKCLRPCFHKTVHGQPAIWSLDFSPLIYDFVTGFGWTDVPNFNELKIPFACVASGITKTPEIVKSLNPPTGPLSPLINLTRLTWKSSFSRAAQVAHMLSSENAVVETVLGFDPVTAAMPVGDAIPFSALVPGVLNYEVPKNHYRSIEILNHVFKRDNLFRLTDGGLASNVPVRALRRRIDEMAFKNTNFHIIGVDVFAPQLNDGVFYPLEQVANANADCDAREASVFVRLKNLLSPVNLSPTLSQFKWLNTRFEQEFADEIKVIQYVTKPLMPLDKIHL